MKTDWDSYLKQELEKPKVRQAYEEETKVLNVALTLANQCKRMGREESAL